MAAPINKLSRCSRIRTWWRVVRCADGTRVGETAKDVNPVRLWRRRRTIASRRWGATDAVLSERLGLIGMRWRSCEQGVIQ